MQSQLRALLHGGPRETDELDTDAWRRVLEVLWASGVPQVVFTGGEPTLRENLVILVREAEESVTGLVTNGTRLSELAEPLRDANLDYVQVTLESHRPEIHDKMVGAQEGSAFERTVAGLRQALRLGMEVVTNTTLTGLNASTFVDTLRFGKELGLRSMACNGLICSGRGALAKRNDALSVDGLKGILLQACETARELEIDLPWYTPTCYHELNPFELGFGLKSCSAAAQNMTVQHGSAGRHGDPVSKLARYRRSYPAGQLGDDLEPSDLPQAAVPRPGPTR